MMKRLAKAPAADHGLRDHLNVQQGRWTLSMTDKDCGWAAKVVVSSKLDRLSWTARLAA